MNSRTFKARNSLELIVKHRKSAVIFEVAPNQINKGYDFSFDFTTEIFRELLEYIETIVSKSWTNFKPKDIDSLGADYFEYYDRELDNNGYLRIKENTLIIERPCLESRKLYQFNKRKMESFLFNFRAII